MSSTRISYALGALTFIVAGASFAQAPQEPPSPAPAATPQEPAAEPPAPATPPPPAAPPAPAAPAAPPAPAAAPSPLTQQVGAASFTLYGNIDLYANFMHSSSGRNIIALQDGAILRSRLGLRGGIELADQIKGNFVLEQGINATNGAPADSTRLFDRQAWVGMASPYGEVRVGRQNTEVFLRGGAIDYGERTLGAVINAFGVPSRYDSDLVYMSPRRYGAQFVGHYSFQGSVRNGWFHQRVYQVALDYDNGPIRVGYARVAGKPAPGTPVQKLVTYDNFYANFKHGAAKAYLVYIRSNNNGPTGELFNGSSPLGNTGALVAGTDTGAETYYNIYQVSADYTLTPALRVGALYGWIRDSSGSGKNASGGSAGGFYTFKNIKVFALADVISNDPNAGFRTNGSAGLTKPFTAADDVNGRTITGVQVGLVFRF
ncbi:MAG TPA: porin [Kofleriaceae bacterium]